ncbi:MAG: ZIP family metal transporter, partial [Planctomycetia bacterium]
MPPVATITLQPSAVASLVGYLLLIAGAAYAGGSSVAFLSLGHRRMQVLLSLTAGVMLGVGLLHLLPHAYLEFSGHLDTTMAWVLAGFFLMFLLERAFHGHAHHSADGSHGCGHDSHAHHDHHHDHAHHAPAAKGPWAWCGAFAGLALHSLVDGAALAASVHADGGQGAGLLSGFATFFAIVLHKPFDSLMIATLMIAAGTSTTLRRATTLFYAMIVPIGAIA